MKKAIFFVYFICLVVSGLSAQNWDINTLHRKELQNKYKKFEAFNEKFEIDDNFLAEIRTLADKEKIKFDEKQYNQSLPLIKTQLKALIARDLWDMNEYFQVMNSTNQSVQQALKVLNEGIYSTIIQ
jgi:carboxyl-terminal processing protease